MAEEKPAFLKSSGGGEGSGSPSRIGPEAKPCTGQEAPAGETFGADNPVENTPFPGNMSRG